MSAVGGRRRAGEWSIARLVIPSVILVSCAEAGPPGPAAQMAPEDSPAFFAAAVEFFARNPGPPLIVEPRPLQPEAMLYSIAEKDLLLTDSQAIRLRTQVIRAAGLRTTDATEDWKCVFSSDPHPRPTGSRVEDSIWAARRAREPDSLRLHRQACRSRGESLSLAFGLPQAGTDPEHPERWRIRAVRMLSYGWEVVDLYLVPRADGTWEVVRAETRVGSFT